MTEDLNKAEHRRRVYPEGERGGTYAYSCSCGKREGDYIHRSYALDGWREAHGLEPLISYPLV